MYSMTENLLGKHLSQMLADRSNLPLDEKNQFRNLIREMLDALAAGHSCYPLAKNELALARKSSLVSEGKMTPLIIHHENLYLHRYYNYENRLAAQVGMRVGSGHDILNSEELLTPLFPTINNEIDLQKAAAKLALEKRLAIISGGPGTGKTSTVGRIIGLLLNSFGADTKIALAAPTGKAAIRLQQSITTTISTLPFADEIKKNIPSQAQTIHRLLGVRRNSPQFYHSSENPMVWDVVVVDEASMVDLALMSKLFDALKPTAKLVLLGDKDQLASVESGAVLADLIATLPDNTIILEKSYRFDTAIKKLANAVKENRSEQAWQLLTTTEIKHLGVLQGDTEHPELWQGYAGYHEFIKQGEFDDVKHVFDLFNSFQILCATRRGRRGADNINRVVESQLLADSAANDDWYPGKPVLITRNDYNLGLFNGDVGICLPDNDDGLMKVWFETEDGSIRPYSPYRLPQHQTAYAMTIHKSQGSEFGKVAIILPQEDNPILSRELLYTAVTRARKQLWLLAEQEIFNLALARKTVRYSGLAQMIRDLQPD